MEKLGFIENQTGPNGMDVGTVKSISECAEAEQTQIRARLQELIDEAPSDASIRVFFRQMRSGYKGILRIASAQGEFESEVSGKKVFACLEQLCNQVETQLLNWRARRDLELQAN